MHVATRSNAPAGAGSSDASALAREAVPSEAIVLRRRGFRHRLLRRSWDLKARSWDHGASPDLEAVVGAVLEKAGAAPGISALDVGCGTGSLTLPLATMCAQVIAVDVSSAMIAQLRQKAARGALRNVTCVLGRVEDFDLPSESVDLVVSNYALHHLRDRDKEKLVRSAARWLRPGGRFVVGDIMLGRGRTRRDREIIVSKAGVFLRRGLPGWWRLAKNLVRFGLRVGERPVDMEVWQSYLRRAGFRDISAEPLVAEAGVVAGTKPLNEQLPGHV
jgi:2-polyprenyl-3-methyl-5-hydroxy-6-metoxy-1,4-benzoquinol methylase